MTYWEGKDRTDRRLFFAMNNELYVLDATTGKPIQSFGNNARVPSTIRQIQSGTPGRVFENLIILGSATGEEYESLPGDLCAYDVITGKLVWQFRTVPHPGEMGYCSGRWHPGLLRICFARSGDSQEVIAWIDIRAFPRVRRERASTTCRPSHHRHKASAR